MAKYKAINEQDRCVACGQWEYRYYAIRLHWNGVQLALLCKRYTISWNEKAFLLIFFRLHGYYSYICNLFLKSR